MAKTYSQRDTDQSPATSAVAVTPHDATNLAEPSRALYIGVTGDVSVEMTDTGTAVVFTAVPAGTVLPIRVTRVNATATDATNIVSIY